jgi:hypothetical protein
MDLAKGSTVCFPILLFCRIVTQAIYGLRPAGDLPVVQFCYPCRIVIRYILVAHPPGATNVRPIRLSCRIVRRRVLRLVGC